MSEQKSEFFNALTHGFGLVLFIAATPLLISSASIHGNVTMILATTLYCFSLLMVFATSTLYHAITEPSAKATLRVLDHIAIFMLIAGTYTPLLIRYLGMKDAGKYLAVIWMIGVIGMIYKLFFTAKWRWFSISLYVAMGCMVLYFYEDVFPLMSEFVVRCIWVGGVSYLVGAVIYGTKRLPYFHAIWHVFVLMGALFHFIAIAFAVLYN